MGLFFIFRQRSIAKLARMIKTHVRIDGRVPHKKQRIQRTAEGDHVTPNGAMQGTMNGIKQIFMKSGIRVFVRIIKHKHVDHIEVAHPRGMLTLSQMTSEHTATLGMVARILIVHISSRIRSDRERFIVVRVRIVPRRIATQFRHDRRTLDQTSSAGKFGRDIPRGQREARVGGAEGPKMIFKTQKQGPMPRHETTGKMRFPTGLRFSMETDEIVVNAGIHRKGNGIPKQLFLGRRPAGPRRTNTGLTGTIGIGAIVGQRRR